MYQVDEKDKVIELQDVLQSCVGAPLPTVLSNEHKLLLSYYLQNTPENWSGKKVKVVNYDTENEFIALVEFDRYLTFMSGMPNDEAFSGHPLFSRGLQPYTVFEIENSSWLRKLEKMNSVHPYHKPENFEKFKHYVFAFHDSTFECIAEGFEISYHQCSMKEILLEMQNRLLGIKKPL